ncbi:MAG: hypothetical protein Q8O54_07745 [Brevundimonas sp.]|nr:hypothetical protein [Brevundimonas sp.]
MKPTLVAALCALLSAAPTAVFAQDDDWEFAEDPARNLTVAAVRYDGGTSLVVLCRDGVLTTVVTGLPTADRIELQATRADGRSDTQVWLAAGQPGALLSSTPEKDARFLRGGGTYEVRTVEGQAPVFRTSFDLPTQFANLDRVLLACESGLSREEPETP